MSEQRNVEKVRLNAAEKARIAAVIPEAEYGEYDAERMRFEVGQAVEFIVSARVTDAVAGVVEQRDEAAQSSYFKGEALNEVKALLIQADSLLSLIRYREARGLSDQSKRDADALIGRIRAVTG